MIFIFFNFLKKTNIDFCIINGYKEIVAKTNTNSDIDILFKRTDFINIERILQDFCVEKQFLIVQMMHHSIWAKNFFIFNPQNGEYLNLDLYAELSRKEIIYFKEKDIFNTLTSYENIPILSTEKEFINYFIKKLDKNDISKSNFNHLYMLFLKDEKLCKKELCNFFPKKNDTIIKAFKKNDFNFILNNHKTIINDFYSLNKNSSNKTLINLLRVIKRIVKPTGLTISFLGPDGAGKSTIINELLKHNLPFRRNDYFHLKPIKQNEKLSVVIDNPHAKPPHSKIKSYIKLFYFIYQYNIGWLKNILKLKIKSSLIIFDRYYDDLLVDNKRYRYAGSLVIAKFVRNLIPKPDIYFILTTEAKIIYARKQEVPFEELERQIESYRSLSDGNRYFNIDVNREPEEIVKEIIGIMMEKMNERY